ncbi:MAG: nuclear transport factor 2 family protein [Bryobacteraceae bacterium]
MPGRNFEALNASLELSDALAPDPKRVVLAIFAAVSANDFQALEAYFTADAELHIYGFPASEGSWLGRENVLRAIESNFAMITDQHPRIESIVQQEHALALRMSETGTLKAGSHRYEAHGVTWFTFEGSRVKKIEEFFHSVVGASAVD